MNLWRFARHIDGSRSCTTQNLRLALIFSIEVTRVIVVITVTILIVIIIVVIVIIASLMIMLLSSV